MSTLWEDKKMRQLSAIFVENNPELHDPLEAILTAQNVSVTGRFRNADRAVRRAQAIAPDFAIIDVWLGEMSGYELIRALKRRTPRIKIIAASVEAYGKQAVGAGADAFILKEELADKLAPTLRRLFPRHFAHAIPRLQQ
jgi:DNA-binding NarL/FixJ family response regulator